MAPSEIIEERILFASDGPELEGVLTYPGKGQPDVYMLLLAPHPHMGGNMENNLILHLARRAAEDGYVTLRFNYRGVGKSGIELPEGETLYEHWDAMERDQRYEELLPDVLSAKAQLDAISPCAKGKVVLGYSLGVALAGMLSGSADCTRFIGVSPPVVKVSLDSFASCNAPKLFIAGDKDFAFTQAKFDEEFSRLPEPKSYVHLAGCDHFYRQEEERVYEALLPFLNEGA